MSRRLTGVIAAVLVLGLAATVAIAAPEIHVDSETYDFGSIIEGYLIERTFVLTNVGDETLIIDNVYAPCSCTRTELATNELEPGESVDLHVAISSNGYGGRTISKVVYVYSNDPQYPQDDAKKLKLYVSGAVLRNRPYSKTIEDLYLYSIFLIDLRAQAEFDSGHFVGAVNIEPEDVAATVAGFSLPGLTLLVLYDATGAVAGGVVDGLVTGGYPLARALLGGLARWTQIRGTRYLFPEPTGLDYGEAAVAGEDETYIYDPAYFDDAFYVLIDLREPEAFAAGHLAGATNIPYTEFTVADLDDRLGDLPSDAEIILYDQTGAQSDTVAQILIAAGYVNAKSLLGGLDEWQRVYGDELIWADTP